MAYSADSSVNFNPPVYIGCLFPMDDDQRELEEQQRRTWSQWEQGSGAPTQDQSSSTTTSASTTTAPTQQSQLSTSFSSDYNTQLFYETIAFPFLERTLQIRQFDAHVTNANAVWPEATFLAEWLTGVHIDLSVDNPTCSSFILAPGEDLHASHTTSTSTSTSTTPNLERLRWLLIDMPSSPSPPLTRTSLPCYREHLQRRRVIELGSATGALAIYLRLHGVDLTTSDLIDDVVTDNIAHNFRLNGLEPQHLAHTWGESLNALRSHLDTHGYYDVILGSDILAYEAQFPHLVQSLCVLMPCIDDTRTYIGTVMYMCWKRRHKRKTENLFFDLLREQGFSVRMNRQRIYEIKRA